MKFSSTARDELKAETSIDEVPERFGLPERRPLASPTAHDDGSL